MVNQFGLINTRKEETMFKHLSKNTNLTYVKSKYHQPACNLHPSQDTKEAIKKNHPRIGIRTLTAVRSLWEVKES
jgi:hypothetical protein